MRMSSIIFPMLVSASLLSDVKAIMPNNSPDEMPPNVIEGDILPEETETSRQGIDFDVNPDNKWPKDEGSGVVKVHYNITDYAADSEEYLALSKAIAEWNAVFEGCIQWVELSSALENPPKAYVEIRDLQGCYSKVGKRVSEGGQTLSLASHCTESKTIVLHEMEHVLGMDHEHNRYDRDQYIKILYENIFKPAWRQFEILEPGQYELIGEYDYYSITHYGVYDLGSKPVFKILKDGIDEGRVGKGENNSFSKGDIAKVKSLYDCH